jgi:deoxycytidylate deaminase
MSLKIDKRKCAKQEVIAIILNDEEIISVGSNWCANPQEECPRKDLPTGKGYEMCKEICQQPHHAEVDVCMLAGKRRGNKMIIFGHTYCCDECKKIIMEYGIKEVYFIGERVDIYV